MTNTTNKPEKSSKEKIKNEAPLLRGSLKLEASSATPIVTAGTEFSIFLVIRNPFPVPVTIYSTETHIPVELSDQIWTRNKFNEIHNDRIKQGEKAINLWDKTVLKFKHIFQDVILWVNPPKSPRVAIAVSPETQSTIEPITKSFVIEGSVNSQRDAVFGDQWNLDFKGLGQDEIRKIFWDINEYQHGRRPVTLRPGDSVVQHFVLKTTRWLTFTPIAHTFQIQVRYEIDGNAHTDTIPFALNIRAATASTLIGAIIGSMLGAIVNPQNSLTDSVQVGRILLTSSIFAVIIVVAFARKNSVQQIVSVEDFWGGIFIGFLVGYSGESFIGSVLGSK